MRISDGSSDVCSSDLIEPRVTVHTVARAGIRPVGQPLPLVGARLERGDARDIRFGRVIDEILGEERREHLPAEPQAGILPPFDRPERDRLGDRSEEHTSELQSLMRFSYADYCLTKKHETHL